MKKALFLLPLLVLALCGCKNSEDTINISYIPGVWEFQRPVDSSSDRYIISLEADENSGGTKGGYTTYFFDSENVFGDITGSWEFFDSTDSDEAPVIKFTFAGALDGPSEPGCYKIEKLTKGECVLKDANNVETRLVRVNYEIDYGGKPI